jgi:hypothetical protein
MRKPLVAAVAPLVLGCLVALSDEPKKPGSTAPEKSASDPRFKAGFYDVDARLQSYSLYELVTQYPAVQDELRMTAPQKDRLKAIQAKLARYSEENRKNRQVMPPAEDLAVKAQRRLLGRQAAAAFFQEAEAAALNALDRSQRRRLDEIRLQAEGPLAFLRAEVQERLNMDEQQIETLTAIVAEAREAMKQRDAVPAELRQFVHAAPGGKIETEPEHVDEMKAWTKKRFDERVKERESLYRAIGKVLRAQQRALYDKMRGERFEIMELRRPAPSALPAAKDGRRAEPGKG